MGLYFNFNLNSIFGYIQILFRQALNVNIFEIFCIFCKCWHINFDRKWGNWCRAVVSNSNQGHPLKILLKVLSIPRRTCILHFVYTQWLIGGLISYLPSLCLLAFSAIELICCQFLWIDHIWLDFDFYTFSVLELYPLICRNMHILVFCSIALVPT